MVIEELAERALVTRLESLGQFPVFQVCQHAFAMQSAATMILDERRFKTGRLKELPGFGRSEQQAAVQER